MSIRHCLAIPTIIGLLAAALVPRGLLAALPAPTHEAALTLKAETHNSGFPLGHDTYNGLSAASDGRIYYVLSTVGFDDGARMFVFDPATGKIRDLGGLTEACGEQGRKAVVQGKSHVGFVESKGKLYFATHVGYYSIENGMETMGVPPEGYQPYPGGHLLAYDMATGKFDDLAIAPRREGILSMNMDTARGRIFGLTWPTGRFFRFDLARSDFKDFGPVRELGESGRGLQYRTICRSIAVDPGDGSAYYTDSEGTIHRYRAAIDAVETVQGDDLKKDYFGLYDPTSPGHMGYNWRQVVWVPSRTMLYGVHGNSGYLFRFDPRAERVEVLDRITSIPSQRAGCSTSSATVTLGSRSGRMAGRCTTSPAALCTSRESASPARRNRPWASRKGSRIFIWSPTTCPPANPWITERSFSSKGKDLPT